MKVRIKQTPLEAEVDGVKLSTLIPGPVRDVPSSLGLWLIAKGYAQQEMRVETRRAQNGAPEHSTSGDHYRRIGSERRKRTS